MVGFDVFVSVFVFVEAGCFRQINKAVWKNGSLEFLNYFFERWNFEFLK